MVSGSDRPTVTKPVANANNLGLTKTTCQSWAGIAVELIDQKMHPGRAWQLVSSPQPLLCSVVHEVGGRCEARPAIGARCANWQNIRKAGCGGHISLLPAGEQAWGYSENIARMVEVRIELDPGRLVDLMHDEFSNAILDRPRFMFLDHKLQSLARLLAHSSNATDRSDLFGDHIMMALLARLFQLDDAPIQPRYSAGVDFC